MKKMLIFAAAAMAAACLLCSCGAQGDASSASAQTGTADAVVLVADIATTQYFTDEAVKESDVETILLAGVNAPSAMNGQPWHFTVITDAAVLEQISGDMAGGMSFGGGNPPAMEGMPDGAVPGNMQLPEGMEPPAQAPAGLPEGLQGMEPPAGFSPSEGAAPPAGFGGGAVKAGLADAPLAIVVSCKDGSELDAGLACQNMSVAARLLGYGTKIISSPTMALNGEKQAEYRQLLGIPENQSAAAILLVGREDVSVDESVEGYTGATERNPLSDVVTYVN